MINFPTVLLFKSFSYLKYSPFFFNSFKRRTHFLNNSFLSKKMNKIPNYEIHERNARHTEQYRIYFANSDVNTTVSPMHDIPYKVNPEKNIFHMVVEIPRWTNAKMEISTKESMNPIKQDVKKGALRYIRNIFPFHGYIWNYGAIPQTWENPDKVSPDTGCKGDNDPIDACEIGSKIHKRGAIIQVKVLGCYALIDEGETDYKLIVIDVNDPMSEKLNNLKDVEKIFPGLLTGTREWFRLYKVPDGKPKNEFAFNGEPKDYDFALNVLEECHKEWEELITNKIPNISGIALHNTSLINNPHKIDDPKSLLSNASASSPEPGSSISDLYEIEKWHYVDH